MLFNSPAFVFLFLPIVLAGFLLLRKAGSWAIGWLTAASLVFYSVWDPPYVTLILASIGFNFLMGRAIATAASNRLSKTLMIAGIGANLGVLFVFKYAAFAAGIFGYDAFRLVLPLGISFVTFQKIAYLADCHRDRTYEPSLLRYALFVTFFPQLIAGPIVHHGEVLPQFRKEKLTVRTNDLLFGAMTFVLGLSKKVIVADGISGMANASFDMAATGQHVGMAGAWIGAILFAFQIYFDFSGYSDMAIGLARMFGIQLPINFDTPYRSTNIIDFWRRWHMTLSRFLRDYLYIPLGGNRKGPARRYMNLLLTMLLGGLWHGASWNFVVWGGLHGGYLVANHVWRERRPENGKSRLISWALTFVAVVYAWVWFRSATPSAALDLTVSMTGGHGIGFALVSRRIFLIVLLLGILTFALPDTRQIVERLESQPRPRLALWSCILGILFFLDVKSFFATVESPFIYFNF